jgi:hypothetical protein
VKYNFFSSIGAPNMQIFLKMASEKGGVPKKGENSEKGGKSAETDASED